MSRDEYENPLKDVVEGIRKSKANPRIACTQLSTHCHAKDLADPTDHSHLDSLPVAGKAKKACCAGTLRVYLPGGTGILSPKLDHHRKFIKSLSSEVLCKTQL